MDAVLAALLFAASALPTHASELGWMSGCWRADGEPGNEEHWLKPAGGSVLGISRTVRHERTVAYEYMRIVEENGGLVFVASPSGQRETAFPLVAAEKQRLVFENKTHDFPQRVIYARDGDRLVGRIEGIEQGKPHAIDFPLERTDCD